jgi:hypothetical protein
MTKEEQQHLDLQNMILEIAGKTGEVVKDQPMAFALAVSEVAFAMGVAKGMERARDQIAAHFSRK